MSKDRSGTGLQKALKPLRNSLPKGTTSTTMWVAVAPWGRLMLPFFLTETEAKNYCDELAGTNISAISKRVNITITFPSTSQGDIS